MLEKQISQIDAMILDLRSSDKGQISRLEIVVLEQFMDPDWIFLCKGDALIAKMYYNYCHVGGVSSLNQNHKLW